MHRNERKTDSSYSPEFSKDSDESDEEQYEEDSKPKEVLEDD